MSNFVPLPFGLTDKKKFLITRDFWKNPLDPPVFRKLPRDTTDLPDPTDRDSSFPCPGAVPDYRSSKPAVAVVLADTFWCRRIFPHQFDYTRDTGRVFAWELRCTAAGVQSRCHPRGNPAPRPPGTLRPNTHLARCVSLRPG